jgi:hypothetical protein
MADGADLSPAALFQSLLIGHIGRHSQVPSRGTSMRYYFHALDRAGYRDEEGTELIDPKAARRHAVAYAGECMHYEPDILLDRKFHV